MSRNLAALVALAALCGLVLQFLVSGATAGLADPLLRLWALGRFFTILTNALVFVSFALVALGRNPGDSWMAGVVLSIGMVGLVFHLLLAPEVPLTGLTFWADLWLHTLTPLFAGLWWLGWGGRALTLDGQDAVIEIEQFKGIGGNQARSVAAWIKTKETRGEVIRWGADDFGKMWIFGFVRGRIGITPGGGYLYINRSEKSFVCCVSGYTTHTTHRIFSPIGLRVCTMQNLVE